MQSHAIKTTKIINAMIHASLFHTGKYISEVFGRQKGAKCAYFYA